MYSRFSCMVIQKKGGRHIRFFNHPRPPRVAEVCIIMQYASRLDYEEDNSGTGSIVHGGRISRCIIHVSVLYQQMFFFCSRKWDEIHLGNSSIHGIRHISWITWIISRGNCSIIEANPCANGMVLPSTCTYASRPSTLFYIQPREEAEVPA